MSLTLHDLRALGYDVLDGRAVRIARADVRARTTVHRADITPVDRPRGWTEERERQRCLTLLRSLGWRVWSLSQPRATKQSAGLPDILARHLTSGMTLWVECKRWPDPAPWTADQQAFAASCAATGEHYVLGTEADLRAWLDASAEMPGARDAERWRACMEMYQPDERALLVAVAEQHLATIRERGMSLAWRLAASVAHSESAPDRPHPDTA